MQCVWCLCLVTSTNGRVFLSRNYWSHSCPLKIWALSMLKSATKALIVTFLVATVRVNLSNFTSQLSILVDVFDFGMKWVWSCPLLHPEGEIISLVQGVVRLKLNTGSKHLVMATPGMEILNSFPFSFLQYWHRLLGAPGDSTVAVGDTGDSTVAVGAPGDGAVAVGAPICG